MSNAISLKPLLGHLYQETTINRRDLNEIAETRAETVNNVMKAVFSLGDSSQKADKDLREGLFARNWTLVTDAFKRGGSIEKPEELCWALIDQGNLEAAHIVNQRVPYGCVDWGLDDLYTTNVSLYRKVAYFYYQSKYWSNAWGHQKFKEFIGCNDFETAKGFMNASLHFEKLLGDHYNGSKFHSKCLIHKADFAATTRSGFLAYHSVLFLCKPTFCDTAKWTFWLDNCHLISGYEESMKAAWLREMAFQGHSELVALLLSRDADPNDVTGLVRNHVMDRTPLEFAVLNDDGKTTETLITNNASAYIQYPKEEKPSSIFDIAFKRGNRRVILAFSGHVNDKDQQKIEAFRTFVAAVDSINNPQYSLSDYL